jgi:excisionase family DNA binding protein
MPTPDLGQFFDKKTTDSTALLSVADAAELLGVSASAIRRLQQGRHLPFFKVGRCVRFAESDLLAYLAKRRIETID